ncbi:GP55 protein [Mycobacteroides abscessus]|nr:GP55 protein [Mycobacteroides abscessus]
MSALGGRATVLTPLIIFTLCAFTWSLWIRRMTWKCKGQFASTLNIALQALAVALMSPWASITLGEWLYKLTGQRNLEDLLAHDCYIVAASAIVHNAISQLKDQQRDIRFKLFVETPATLAIPLMFLTFTSGAGVKVFHADFFRVPTDVWLTTYWLLMTAITSWLLIYGSQVLLMLRKNPESRFIATVYLWSAGSGVLACAVRAGTACWPGDFQTSAVASLMVWTPACACGAGFALMSAWTWKTKNLLVIVRA